MSNRDEARTHARTRDRNYVACGRRRPYFAYVVAPEEFMRLKTPPAPWCEECARNLNSTAYDG